MKTPTPMTESPRAVAWEALSPYSAARSRKDFTPHQLFAVLALKAFFKTLELRPVSFKAQTRQADAKFLYRILHFFSPWASPTIPIT